MSINWFRTLSRGPFFESLRQSHRDYPVNAGFLRSSSFNFVNPRHNVITTTDCVTQKLLESDIARLSDEEVLSLFTTGFFGGYVFACERLILKAGGWKLLSAQFSNFQDDPAAMAIWNHTKIPSTNLLPLGSRFFGSFKLIDMHISKASGMEPSYVDYGFGSDRSRFAGCHRVQVTRSPQPEISLQQFICNPTKDTPATQPPYHNLTETIDPYLFLSGDKLLENPPVIESIEYKSQPAAGGSHRIPLFRLLHTNCSIALAVFGSGASGSSQITSQGLILEAPRLMSHWSLRSGFSLSSDPGGRD
ncbi:hypothetical protein ANOM_007261 [Aspergillus nomiae NRRL 13137]|uniref:Uncharacterized protein n=1 Tax=Aspergillus nomiae NRRL (strain ATCC 15546 / NRRL 13137 / CBS 260.88 / M93) TaxID=1509407 RepID=A0A0L1IXM3_ASPN3|nr:uncharacterized protein ANOM_007261 [Aspergillus nomiae NRRL 13137]KNG84306.1 hypothetical protein ANOM_007261 [Aspergillus nomiae NRRL 13137]